MMTADAQSLTLPVAAPSTATKTSWIESPLFDLTFFSLSPLTTLPIALLALSVDPRFGLLFFFLAFPHYLSTVSLLMWDEAQPRQRAQRFAFVGGPILIALAYTVVLAAGLPKIMQVSLFLWNTFHVARQSCGILSIYRHRSGVFDPMQKTATNFAIIAVSTFLSFWNIETHDAFGPLARITPRWPLYMKIGSGVVAAAGVVWLAFALWKRYREGKRPTLAEWAFLATSILLFTPFLVIPTSIVATAVMLLPHYVQYLGLVWLLNRRRFRTPEGSAHQRALQKVSSSLPMLIGMLLAIGIGTAVLKIATFKLNQETVFEAIYLLIAFEHFYMDGLVWAFKDPAVRKSFGPYLTGYDAASAKAT